MLIYKILNNNAVISKDYKNKEIIVTGKGIAFKKGQYDEIDENKILKIYIPKDTCNKNRLEEMISKIPYIYFEIAEDIKTVVEDSLSCKLDECFSLNLCDHIHYAIEKTKKNISTPNLMLNEIKQFYSKEFEVSKIALDIIRNKIGILLNEDEAGFIAFHIITNEDSIGLNDLNEMMTNLKSIINIIEEYFELRIDKNSNEYFRLITHLKFFLSRVKFGKSNDVSLTSDPLFEMLVTKYDNINRFIDKLDAYMLIQFEYKITDTDRMYLIIHLARCIY